MEHSFNNARTVARHKVAGVWCVLVSGLLSSCNPGLVQIDQHQETGAAGTRYSMVFIIHGDGNYGYHDTAGNEYRADEVALASARKVAGQNPHAEVFIYHQRPRRLFLFLFPLNSGEFYFYQNGQLAVHESYRRDEEQQHFEPELELYRRFVASDLTRNGTMFLYYGHELPEFGGRGYDASTPDRTFTVQDLAAGLQGFTSLARTFDLLVLSTCFGGTPHTIGALSSFARTIVASPGNLHLSYFDMHPLERLDLSLQDGDVPAFAKSFARLTFDRLTRNVRTAVSVAVYDTDRVQEFIDSVGNVYDRTLAAPKGEASRVPAERCDCADLPQYALSTMSRGVDVLFRPARFGRSAQKQEHSGWECWEEKGRQDVHSPSVESPLK